MKRIIFTIAIAFMGYASFGQQASQLIPTQGLNPKTFTPPNFLYVNQADNRIWPVLADSVRLKYINIKWINDSVIVIGTRKFVRKDSVYSNPSFIANIDYNTKIANKPNLSNFLTSEVDPLFSAQIVNYRTKNQNDALYQPVGPYLTIETDPTVPAYSKGLTSFSVIKSSTDPLYKAIGYAPSYSEITGKPTTLSGLGITDGVTSSALSSSLSNYVLTSTYTAGLAAKQNSLTLTTTGSGAATLIGSTLNIPTPVVNAYTAGTGISVSGNVITNTSPDQTVVIAGSNGVTASGTYPNFNIQQTTPTYNNAPGRTLGTSFRPSTTRPTRVSYTVSITTAISLLNLNSAGSVALQISSDNINFTTINSAGISRTLAVSISVGLNETTMFNIQGEVPAGFYCRLQGTVSGGATSTFTSGQEVTY